MKVYIKEPKQKPRLEEVENTLEALQKIVGGYIETVTLPNAVVICNEEGRIQNLEPNCVVISFNGVTPFVGTIVIAGIDGEEFSDCTAEVSCPPTADNSRLYVL